MSNSAESNAPRSAAGLIDRLLRICIGEKSSDIHLAPDHPPYLRTQGVLLAIPGEPPISAATLREMGEQLAQGFNTESLDTRGSIDGALSAHDGTRFRFNVYRRGGEISIALRRLEDRIRTLPELGLPENLYKLSDISAGLVLVAGPTGCGKSTTLASLIDRINQTRRCHIVTIEDPIEYIHPSRMSLVNQRQVGTDAPTFYDALVASLRQDPDVILVGEIRDLETIRTAITASETGHLVFATVHAGDCVGSLDRLVSVFPSDEQPGIRRQLSMVLRAVIAQHLLVADGAKYLAPAASENGQEGGEPAPPPRARLVLASEVLLVNPSVANLIALAKDSQIYSMMETGGGGGMYTMEECLARLWIEGEIQEATARTMSRNPRVMLDRAGRMHAQRGGRGTVKPA